MKLERRRWKGDAHQGDDLPDAVGDEEEGEPHDGRFGASSAGVKRESAVCDNEAWRCAGGVCLPQETVQRGEGSSVDEGQPQ